MYTNKNKDLVEDKAPYTGLDGTKYPSNFPKSEISELSLVATTTAQPTIGNVITGSHIDNTNTQVWDTRVKTQTELDSDIKAQAIQALYKSDSTMNRILEAVIEGLNTLTSPDVLAYSKYRKDLRKVIRGSLATLPVAPVYPKGT